MHASGRVFVSFPRWAEDHIAPQVCEVVGGQIRAYPDMKWNSWQPSDGGTQEKFICIQSVFVDHLDRMWVLDPGAAFFGPVIPGGPKIVRIDLQTNCVVRVYPIPAQFTPENAYMNDVRTDASGKYLFVTDSNLGHILVVNVETGKVRATLAGHYSTKPEQVVPRVEGTDLRFEGVEPGASGMDDVFMVHVDGLAVVNQYVYYCCVTARTLYRVPVAVLVDESLGERERDLAVEKVGPMSLADGMVAVADANLEGDLYTTALEKNAINKYDFKRRVGVPVVMDARLQWPDSLACAPVVPDQPVYVYATISQVHRMVIIKGAKPRNMPYLLVRVRVS